ncbi:MAG: hypothetical protein EGR90_04355 [Lachnospiraceae bacterium]|nr:hypothetical protein [Lachnospiraceae bacterium]
MRKSSRLTVGLLAAVMAASLYSVDANASANVTTVLPNGGVNLSLAKAAPLESIQTEKVSATSKIEASVCLEDMVDVLNESLQDADKDEEEELFRNLVIAQVNAYVNVRSLPSEEGEIVGKLYDDSVGTFIEEDNGWYKINSGSVTGYVKAEYCVTGEDAVELAKKVGTRLATVTTTTLYVRMEPTTDSKVLSMVPEGDDFLVMDETDDWAKINVEEGDGWVSKDYLEIHTEFVEAESKEEEQARLAKEEEERKKAREAAKKSQAGKQTSSQTTQTQTTTYAVGEGSELGKSVAEYALQFVGNPYVYGGTSLTNGTDCSGFVMSVYANFGVSLPHSSKSDRSQGAAVDGLANAQPGDLVCYSGHVALYIGNGQIVHASNAKTGIIVSNADYKKVLAVRRIF